MNVEKKILADIERCYTTSIVNINNEKSIVFGSDGKNTSGDRFYGKNFEENEKVWENLGGTMSIKQIPGRENELLVLQDFYLGDSPSNSKVVWYKYVGGKWEAKDLIHLPFTHRMDVLEIDNEIVVILATVSDFKSNKEDWTIPGSVYAFSLDSTFYDLTTVVKKKILGNIHYNHGYYRDNKDIYIAGFEGVFHLQIQSSDMNQWLFEKIYDNPTSDLIISDLDGDGINEMVVINEFHGDEFSVLKWDKEKFLKVFSYSEGCEIVHGLTTIQYKNAPAVVIGVRKGLGQLLLLHFDGGKFMIDIIDSGRGPINLATVSDGEREYIVAANHTTHTAMLYRIIE